MGRVPDWYAWGVAGWFGAAGTLAGAFLPEGAARANEPERVVAGAQSHCQGDERTLFSCSVGKKTVSLCASPQLTSSHGWVQYRFGPIGRPEFEYPATREHPRKAFDLSLVQGIRDADWNIAFAPKAFRYTVSGQYAGISQTWEGVLVERIADGKTVGTFACVGRRIGSLTDAYSSLETAGVRATTSDR